LAAAGGQPLKTAPELGFVPLKRLIYQI
jgi:hypothetical protein